MNVPKAIRKLVGAALSGLALFFVFRLLVERWPEVRPHLSTVNGWYLLAGGVGFVVYFLLRAYAWSKIVRLFGFTPRFRDVGRVWFLSEFKRYVPGSVWSFLGRVEASRDLGQPASVTLTGLSLEIVFLTVSSLVVSAVFLISRLAEPLRTLALVAAPLLFALLHPRVLGWLLRLAFRLFRRPAPAMSGNLGDHLRVFAVFLFAWIGYGFGSLLTAAAFVSVPAEHTWTVFGSFVLAWAVGYLSLITPMGLGVREGSLVLLLGSMLGEAVAGLVAVATRLWLVVVEIAVVGSAALLRFVPVGAIDRLGQFIRRRWPALVLTSLIVLYVAFFGAFSVLRHENLNSGMFDLGIMDQTVWNTAHGRPLQLTNPYGSETIHRFAIHFDPFLAVLAPVYLIWSNPDALLLLQTLALGLGAIPVYLFSRSRLGPGLSLTFALAYLTYPALQWANLFDVHAVAFATPLLLAAFAAADRRAYRTFTVFAILAIMTKEEVALLVAMVGLWLWWREKRKYVGINTFVLAGLLGVLITFVLLPAYDVGIEKRGIDYFDRFGDTPTEVVGGVLTHPRQVFSLVVNARTRDYLSQLLGPTAYLSLLAPHALLLAWPEFAINLLSDSPALKQILFQYTSGITPFVFLSAIVGAGFLAKRLAGPWSTVERRTGVRIEGVLIALVLLASAVGAWSISPLPGTKQDFSRVVAWKNRYVPLIQELKTIIPANASVSATNTFGSHFSQREHIYSFPNGADTADYVIVLEGGVKEVAPKGVVSRRVAELRLNPSYEVIREQGSVTVFKRRP